MVAEETRKDIKITFKFKFFEIKKKYKKRRNGSTSKIEGKLGIGAAKLTRGRCFPFIDTRIGRIIGVALTI